MSKAAILDVVGFYLDDLFWLQGDRTALAS